MGKLETKKHFMNRAKFIQPYDTISWAAHSLFSDVFYEKWQAGRLSFTEYRELIDLCIYHVEAMLKKRAWFDLGLIKMDKRRLQMLKTIRKGLCVTMAEAIEHENRSNYSEAPDAKEKISQSAGFRFVHDLFNWC
jgi:hypothetical protein